MDDALSRVDYSTPPTLLCAGVDLVGFKRDFDFVYKNFRRMELHSCRCYKDILRVDRINAYMWEAGDVLGHLINEDGDDQSDLPSIPWGVLWPEQNCVPLRSISISSGMGSFCCFYNVFTLHSKIRLLRKMFHVLTALCDCVVDVSIDCLRRRSEGLVPLEFIKKVNAKRSQYTYLNWCSIFHYATFIDHERSCREMLINKLTAQEVEDEDVRDMTALHVAALVGANECANVLIPHIRNINLRDLDFDTPLHLAVMAGNVRLVHALIHNGADPSIPDKLGVKPAFVAAMMGTQSIQVLLNSNTHIRWNILNIYPMDDLLLQKCVVEPMKEFHLLVDLDTSSHWLAEFSSENGSDTLVEDSSGVSNDS